MKYTVEFVDFEKAVMFARTFARVTKVTMSAAPNESSIIEVYTSISENKMIKFSERYEGLVLVIEPEQ